MTGRAMTGEPVRTSGPASVTEAAITRRPRQAAGWD